MWKLWMLNLVVCKVADRLYKVTVSAFSSVLPSSIFINNWPSWNKTNTSYLCTYFHPSVCLYVLVQFYLFHYLCLYVTTRWFKYDRDWFFFCNHNCSSLATPRQDWTDSNPSRRENGGCGFTLSRSHSCCAVRLVYTQISPGHIWTALYLFTLARNVFRIIRPTRHMTFGIQN